MIHYTPERIFWDAQKGKDGAQKSYISMQAGARIGLVYRRSKARRKRLFISAMSAVVSLPMWRITLPGSSVNNTGLNADG